MTILDTDQLLIAVRQAAQDETDGKRDNCCVEAAALLLDGSLKATHFLVWDNHRLYDEGIDGERRTTSIKQFRKDYKGFQWVIDKQNM